ncbi:BgtA-20335 [Blumeria graminis f. sp. tritici]|uniref:BgtA-20335 n=2 Tax=Blumeria graminis f. sp. tritici TaxID=62690 RepID=A0A9X9QDM6_BLUGR|nr:hypothetical protein BGT96224_A20335 [Blumeria graminis f. sp. tritici 96224]VDB89515.1 BgtA-20335 [Blumeria graminis f. sp. tritici]
MSLHEAQDVEMPDTLPENVTQDLGQENSFDGKAVISNTNPKQNESAIRFDGRDDSSSVPSMTLAASKDSEPSALLRTKKSNKMAPSQPQNNSSNLQASASSDQPFHDAENMIQNEVERLKEVLLDVSPKAAQKVLREMWRVFMFAELDEDHVSFLLRAGLKNANSSILSRVFRDESLYRGQMLEFICRKGQTIARVLQTATSNQLTSLVPESVLDDAIAERLKYVSARDIVNWLASAQRLGYRCEDIINENDESVVPFDIHRVAPYSVRQNETVQNLVNPAPPNNSYLGQQPNNSQYPKDLTNVGTTVSKPSQQALQTSEYQNYQAVEEAPRGVDPLKNKQLRNQTAESLLRTQSPSQANEGQTLATKASSQSVQKSDLICPCCSCSLPNLMAFASHLREKSCVKQITENNRKFIPSHYQPTMSSRNTSQTPSYTHQTVDQSPQTNLANHADNYLASSQRSTPSLEHPQSQKSAPDLQTISNLYPLTNENVGIHTLTPAQLNQNFQGPTQPQQPLTFTPSGSPMPWSWSQKMPQGVQATQKNTKNQSTFSEKNLSPQLSGTEIPIEKLIAMEGEIKQIEDNLKHEIARIPVEWQHDQRQARIHSLKSMASNKKTGIRKSYGVSLKSHKLARKAINQSSTKSNYGHARTLLIANSSNSQYSGSNSNSQNSSEAHGTYLMRQVDSPNVQITHPGRDFDNSQSYESPNSIIPNINTDERKNSKGNAESSIIKETPKNTQEIESNQNIDLQVIKHIRNDLENPNEASNSDERVIPETGLIENNFQDSDIQTVSIEANSILDSKTISKDTKEISDPEIIEVSDILVTDLTSNLEDNDKIHPPDPKCIEGPSKTNDKLKILPEQEYTIPSPEKEIKTRDNNE